jgi:hypothetical protein
MTLKPLYATNIRKKSAAIQTMKLITVLPKKLLYLARTACMPFNALTALIYD